MSMHDRDELLTAARDCGMHRLVARVLPRTESTSA
jgi:hypothetical protein